MIAQAVRLIEETGPLEDGEAMNLAFRNSADREGRVIDRARILGQRFGLEAEIARWRELAPYVWLALSVFVGLVAYGIAVSVVGGDRSINAVLAFLLVLGGHVVTLVMWCFAVLAAWFSRGTAGRLSFGRLFLRLVAWLPLDRGPHSLTLLHATTSLLQRARLIPWAFGLISHAVWALAFVLLLAALWFAFSFRAYSMTWETTILSGDFFVGFVRATGWLPGLLGFPVPDASTVLAAGAAGSDQKAWAWWLIGCIVVYGLVPRIILAGLSWALWLRGKRLLKLDMAHPYYRKLLARFEEMETSIVVDAEQPPPVAASPQGRQAALESSAALAAVGFELPPEHPWPPAGLSSPDGFCERISGTGEERRALLNRLAQVRPYKLLVACNAASSPDRGTERFLREACSYAAHTGILLSAPSAAGTRRWQSWLQDKGMDEIATFTDPGAATAWFQPAHA